MGFSCFSVGTCSRKDSNRRTLLWACPAGAARRLPARCSFPVRGIQSFRACRRVRSFGRRQILLSLSALVPREAPKPCRLCRAPLAVSPQEFCQAWVIQSAEAIETNYAGCISRNCRFVGLPWQEYESGCCKQRSTVFGGMGSKVAPVVRLENGRSAIINDSGIDRSGFEASMHFTRILFRDFEKTASKQFRYDAEDDATDCTIEWDRRGLLTATSRPLQFGCRQRPEAAGGTTLGLHH